MTTDHRADGVVGLWEKRQTEAAGFVWQGNSSQSSSHDLLHEPDADVLNFNWCDLHGTSFCTPSRNQHLPQFCESCFALAAMSSLADRIKILRQGKGPDIQLSAQHVLSCAGAGNCRGGSFDAVFQWLHRLSMTTNTGVSYESANPYMACTWESAEGFCNHADWFCSPQNVARTCWSTGDAAHCTALSRYPNATIREHGAISGASAMKKEIFHRGPIVCGIDSNVLRQYTGGIIAGYSDKMDHAVSVVGWGMDPDQGQFWHVRNTWGEHWGEMGFLRLKMGPLESLNLESHCVWAIPGHFTVSEDGIRCQDNGEGCVVTTMEHPGSVIPALVWLCLFASCFFRCVFGRCCRSTRVTVWNSDPMSSADGGSAPYAIIE